MSSLLWGRFEVRGVAASIQRAHVPHSGAAPALTTTALLLPGGVTVVQSFPQHPRGCLTLEPRSARSQACRRWHSGCTMCSRGWKETRTFHGFLLHVAGASREVPSLPELPIVLKTLGVPGKEAGSASAQNRPRERRTDLTFSLGPSCEAGGERGASGRANSP